MSVGLSASLFLALIGIGSQSSALAAGNGPASDSQPIKISLNQPIDDFLKSTAVPVEKSCLEPTGICWYEIRTRFSDQGLPSIELTMEGTVLLQLNDVARISTATDDAQDRNIEQVTFNIRGLPDNSLHAQHKQFIYQLLSTLLASGWAHFYRFQSARISGSQANKISTANEVLGRRVLAHPWFDPRYQASLDQWLQSSSFYYWNFHRDGVYLLLTENAYWRRHFSEEQLNDWQRLLPARLEQYHHQRNALEEQARAAGIDIETHYQDPPIRALKP